MLATAAGVSVRLTLPLPPSPNRWKKHPLAFQRQKDEYREAAWLAAIQQHKPTHEPPPMVLLVATLYLARMMRDDDNLKGSMKFPLDALRRNQTGAMRWRNGLYVEQGYFVDDDPKHLTIVRVEQIKVAKVADERLVLTLEPAPSTAQQNEPSDGEAA